MSLLGVDLGTSGVRVVAVSCDGATLASHAVATSLSTAGERVESDAERVLAAAAACARHVVADPAVIADPPDAVGFSAQGEAIVATDADLRPLAPMPVSMDGRGVEVFEDLRIVLGEDRFQDITGQPAHPMFSLFKLLAADEVWRSADRFLGIADLVAARWGAEPVTDLTQSARYGVLDVEDRTWSADVLAAAHDLGASWITPGRLPAVATAGTVAGSVSPEAAARTGIRAGTPLVVGLHDQAAAFLGAGGRVGGPSVVSFGSSDCLVVGSEKRPSGLSGTGLATYPVFEDHWLTLAGTAAGGWSLAWLRSVVGDPEAPLAELLEEVASEPPGLLVLPWLAGSGTLDNDPGATGLVAGLRLGTTRAELVRAFMESAGFELARIVEALAERDLQVGPLLATGTGAGNPRALAVRAEALGASLRAVEPEAAGRGAALVAGLGVRAFESPDDLPPPVPAEPAAPTESQRDWYAFQRRRYAELATLGRALPRHP